MRIITRLLLVMLAVTTWSGISRAQNQEISIGETNFPIKKWGRQRVSFEITNNTDWIKYLVVEADISFEGSFVNPRRVRYTNFTIGPKATTTINPEIEIPSNYGQMTFWLRIHDVVDTLDNLSAGQVVYEQPFMMKL